MLVGEDDFSIQQSLDEIKRGIGDQTALAANTVILDGQQLTLDRLQGACGTMPFLAEKRLVVVEGLLRRFEPEAKSGRKATRRNGRQDEYQAIADYLGQIPDFTEMVLLDGRIGSRNPLLQKLAAVAQVKTFPWLKDARLRQWIERRVTEASGSISSPAVELLVRFVGGNLWIMANEVDKLVLFAGGRRIEEEDIRGVVSYAQEANVFAMVDAIVEFRAGVAQGWLQQLLRQGAAPAYLLVMLARQVQLMVRVKELRNQRKSRNDIQHKLGLASDFVLRKAWEQTEKYSLTRLREVYHKLLEADISMKTGKCEGELALNILIAELGQRSTVSA
ncbi:DNA polymerase III subunit delta [Chloroflexota bacterium]